MDENEDEPVPNLASFSCIIASGLLIIYLAARRSNSLLAECSHLDGFHAKIQSF